MKKIIAVLFLLLAIGWSVLAVIYADLKTYASAPGGEAGPMRMVVIRPGERFNDIADILYQRGIIRQPLKFKLLARVYGHDKRIQAGDYRLSVAMSPLEIFDILVKGKVALIKLTIPEGFSLRQIAEAVEKQGLGTAAAFIRLATDAKFVSAQGINAQTLEGYLFPDTYYFQRNTEVNKIIAAMLAQFQRVFAAAWRDRALTLGFTAHEIVTLASIIEKETGTPDERPLIASVFHNRLKKNMRLQSDPTVIYDIPNFDGNITKAHLRAETPYNTYKIKGLPPGPIASPGKAALEAALFPAVTDFLYFVSKNTGAHYFSTNLEEHNRAVFKYQIRGQRGGAVE